MSDFLGTAHACLLLVHPDVRRLEDAVDELLSMYGWPRLSVGRELSAALLSETPGRCPREARRWMKARLGEMSPGPVLCTDVDLLFEPTLELDPLALLRDVGRMTRLVAGRGHLGSLDRAVERVVASLRDWGTLAESDRRYAYAPQRQAFAASSTELEAWLLACALRAHPADELPFADLPRLPELFPFRFTLTMELLRVHPRFHVQRQGSGWEMVRMRAQT